MSDDERKGLPSASPFRRYELCAGSYQLELEAERIGQVAHVKSEDAASGERKHAWLAGEKVELSESELQSAQFLHERAEEQIERIFQGKEYWVLREQRLWLQLNGKPALSGRLDLVCYTPALALVIDYKTGWGEPDAAEQNAQLKVLAVLVAINLPSVQEVVCQIVSGPYGVTEARYSVAELSEAYEEIIRTLRAINAPDPVFNPSPDACRFCGAKLICKALKDQVVDPIKTLALVELPEGGEKAAKLLDEVEILAGLLEQIKEFYSAKFSDPTYSIPGYAMVPGVVRRVVEDWESARTRLAEYLDISEINGAANYRLTDLEKALGKVLKLKGSPLKERMNQILNGLILEKQNAASLKRVKSAPKLVEELS